MRGKWVTTLVLLGLAVLAFPQTGLTDILLTNGGFETVVPIGEGKPSATGYWSGDTGEIVGTSDSIVPRTGSHMLKFLYTEPGLYEASSGGWSQIYQTVDVTSMAGMIATGTATATGSFWSNRIAGDETTDTRFEVRVEALSGDPSGYPTATALVSLRTSIYTDSDINTWEFVSQEITLPTETTYLAMYVCAVENVVNDSTGPVEFHGHYGDDAMLVVVPEPAALSLLAIGGLGLFRRRRRR